LPGTVLVQSWGEKGIFYNPNQVLKRGVYVLTIKGKDGDHDKGSNLNREGIFRVNIGLRRATFLKMFGMLPKRPNAGEIVEMPYDFTTLEALIQESYEFAIEKFRKRK
jgi:hypothetical protein